MSHGYSNGYSITGRLKNTEEVLYKNIISRSDNSVLRLFSLLTLLTSASLIWLIVNALLSSSVSTVHIMLAALVIIVELIRVSQSFVLILFARFAKDPVPMKPQRGLRLAVLTTIVPGKEPLDLVAKTLVRMKQIEPGIGNKMDVWLLDEGNDIAVKRRCKALGVKHFSRKGISKWNTQAGRYKAKTKHGNHNAWRSKYENRYDIVAQMDPDHVPRKTFLRRTLGYFRDKQVAFVVAPQVYGNINQSWIAKAAAFQAYVFHGVIQRGANGLNAPLLIGTNHLYRVSAFKKIGGYQDSIIEDHLTSMAIYAKRYKTKPPFKGVYTPDILAIGEGPTSFTDYFNQQKRWAYGIWEIAMKYTRDLSRGMSKRQALSFMMLQTFYPSVAIAWLLSTMLTLIFGVIVLDYADLGLFIWGAWAYSVVSSLWLFFWLRKFNLAEHERKEWGLGGMSLLLMCIPVYVDAALQAIMKKPLTYAVTAKGSMTSIDNIWSFQPHINWISINLALLASVYAIRGDAAFAETFWIYEHIAICLAPILIYSIVRLRRHLLAHSMLKATQILNRRYDLRLTMKQLSLGN